MWNLITCNTLYDDFLKDRESKRFHKSLQEIKSIVDTKSPKKIPHLKKRSKKAQLQERRQEEIEHNNQILMQKMIIIDTRSYISPHSSKQTRKSLNKEFRSKNYIRINNENTKFCVRLHSAKPVLSKNIWERSEKHWLSIRNQIKKKIKNPSRPSSSRESIDNELIWKIINRKSIRPVTALSSEIP